MATTATVAVTSVGPPSMAAAHNAEEEAAKKRNTDCVYFLASPLTCKKGEECEFRHNENARMNPRDCWYWLGGGCRNRECPFRHPPLETRPATQPPPAAPAHQKKPVPCFYFTQGYCAKGAKCQFLHETATPNVYRLADKAAALAESSRAKVREEPLTEVPREITTPKKDNVYRLQDDPKKGKMTPAKDDDSESSRRAQEVDNRGRKTNKDVYTWKLSEQKQPSEGRDEKKPEKQHSRTNSQETRGEKRKSMSRDKASQESDGNGSDAVNDDFASPKSLAQIREEKRKAEEPSSSPSPKRKRSEVSSDEERRLCNGSDRKAEVEKDEGSGNRGEEVEEEEEDDFARKLRMFT